MVNVKIEKKETFFNFPHLKFNIGISTPKKVSTLKKFRKKKYLRK
jgi:hypothetical protein